MKIFAIDDERAMLEDLCDAIAVAAPNAQIRAFKRARAALEAIELNGDVPDVVFSDIELPGTDGLVFSSRLRKVAPKSKIVFVTAYPSYAADAYKMHVDGFVVKPVEAARVREELEVLFPSSKVPKNRMIVRCFGTFEVFLDGKPFVFPRQKTKELFAFLVDRAGGTCASAEIIAALWEEENARNRKAYLRVINSDLRSVLESVGEGDVVIHKHGQWAVRTDLLDCDYFRLLEGDPDARSSYHGEYMRQYSWAEETAARLFFKAL